jgi:hypothetical protein
VGLNELEAERAAQKNAIGRANLGTDNRIKAVDALRAWVTQLRRIAKVALRGRPDLLAKLRP